MVSLTITHDDGSTDTINQTLGWTRTRELGAMRRARIDVERSAAKAANLEPKQDTVALGSIDTLRLVDLETGGPTWTLVCYSLEWDANRVAPTAGGNLRSGDDQSLVNGLVSEVSSWTAGTVNSFTGPMEFVFNHAHRHEALRRIERNVPGELQWRDEGTVDYLDRLGADKTGSVTISAAEGNVEGEVQITKRGRELDGTHFRILGAHEGEAQISANLVPSDDSATYENRVNYTTSRWSDGDARDWDRWSNKDVMSQSTIEEEAAALGEELEEPLVEAEATVYGEDLSVGDTVRVVKQDADLDRHMRVHRIKTISDAAKRVCECLFSTRTTVRKGDSHDLEDIQRFNTAFQGSSVAINVGPYRDSVDEFEKVTVPFRYPDLEYENKATVQVRGLEYRIDSKGAADGGGVAKTTQSGGVNSDTTNAVPNSSGDSYASDAGTFTHNGGTEYPSTISLSSTDTGYPFIINISLQQDGTTEDMETLEVATVENTTTGDLYPIMRPITGTTPTGRVNGYGYVPDDISGDTLELGVTASTASSNSADITYSWEIIGIPPHSHEFDWLHDHQIDIPNHTHDPQPGIYGTNDTPTSVDLFVNDNIVAADIGSGTFETEVDVSGEFNTDAWNEISLASDTLGDVQVSIFVEGYDQIGAE